MQGKLVVLGSRRVSSDRFISDVSPIQFRPPLLTETAATKRQVPSGTPVRGVRSGTVFVSFDDGDDWQPLRQNMPATSIRDLAAYETDLAVGTHGQTFWILNDISLLC